MAIYHFSVKNISRSDGRSAVAAAAYRSGEKLIDNRQGKEQDYTKKSGVELKKIYAPKHTNPELLERNNLWNTVERVESRKNSQLAREFEIAFPHELKKQEREQMLDDLSQEIVKRHGVIVDAAIHAPHTDSGSDARNYHAHIMLTTRSVNEHGELGKKTREFNDNGKQEVEFWREKFADIANKHLARAGHLFAEVDHRSYAEQNNGLEATTHEGYKVTQLRRQGIDTEISLNNDAIKARNAEKFEQIIKGLDQEILATEKNIAKLRTESPQSDKNNQNHTTLHEEKKERLERNLEPSTETKDAPSIEVKIRAVGLFNQKIVIVARQIHEQELKNLKEQMAESMALANKSFEHFENHRKNKPINPFKIKAWELELSRLADKHNNGIKAKWENLKSDYDRLKNRGVTYEHNQKAIKHMAQNYPDDYKKIMELQREIEAHSAATRETKTQDRQPDRDRGR